jgi:hypothetical protein
MPPLSPTSSTATFREGGGGGLKGPLWDAVMRGTLPPFLQLTVLNLFMIFYTLYFHPHTVRIMNLQLQSTPRRAVVRGPHFVFDWFLVCIWLGLFLFFYCGTVQRAHVQ